MTTTTIELTVTDELAQLLAQMLETRPKDTIASLAQRCFEFGVKNKAYRTERNKKVYAQTKAEGALIDSMKSDPTFKKILDARMKEMGY